MTEEDVAVVRRLRGAIFSAAMARIAGRPLPRPSVAVINELAALAPPSPLLADDRRTWATPATGTQALSAIARETPSTCSAAPTRNGSASVRPPTAR